MEFCALPIDVLRFILLFLSPTEIATLDNAITNRKERETFLLALIGLGLSMMGSCGLNKARSEAEVRWFLARGVILTSIWITFDHPRDLPQLILRSAQRITRIGLIFLSHIGSELSSAICQCSNLQGLTIMNCEVTDTEMDRCFRHLTKLKHIFFSSTSRLTAASIQSLIRHCPRLNWVSFKDVPCVSDDELKDILEGFPDLHLLSLTNVNITDRSMTLLAQSHIEKEIVEWKDCPRVTRDAELSYLRQLHLSQLFSDNESKQLLGLEGFHNMIPYRSEFPIEQFISLGFFSQVQNITSSKQRSKILDSMIMHTIFLFERLIESGYTPRLMEIGFVDFMIHSLDHINDEILRREWLHSFIKISRSDNQCQILISKGILPKLMTLSLVRHTCFNLNFPLF